MRLLLSVLATCSLTASGCLRWGYAAAGTERDKSHDAGGGSGADGAQDAGPSAESGMPPSDAAPGEDASPASDAAADSGNPVRDAAANDAAPSDAAQTDPDTGVDAAPSDGGMNDAATDAATHDSGPPLRCAETPGSVYCYDFEGTALLDPDYDVQINGMYERSTRYKRSGVYSLRATTVSSNEGKQARYASEALKGQMSGEAWLRYYYLVPTTTVINDHFSAGVMSEGDEPFEGFSLHLYDSHMELSWLDLDIQINEPFPRDRWVCVEHHVVIAAAGVVEIFIDSRRVAQSQTMDTIPATGYTAAEVGIHYAGPSQGPVEAFVDDVAVGTARIPCE